MVYDPGLGNDYQDDVAEPDDDALLARDTGSPVASAVLGRAGLRGHFEPDDRRRSRPDGAHGAHRRCREAKGSPLPSASARPPVQRRTRRRASLAAGFGDVRGAYQSGWHDYIGSLKPAPKSADRTLYHASVMTLAAHEDKTFRGGYIASPTMPWVWGTGLENPSGAYHLVWSRDLYQIATALIAAGDTAGRQPRGRLPLPQTAEGRTARSRRTRRSTARRTGPTSSSTRSRCPIVLAWQLGRTDGGLYTGPHQEGRGLPRQLPGRAALAVDPAGALGEPERLLAGHDRVRDRGPRLRRGHRAEERRHGLRAAVRGHRRRLAEPGRRLDRHHHRPVCAEALLPAADEGREPGLRHGLQHRRQRARRSTSARSSTRASSSSCASGSSAPTTRRSRTP